MVTEIYKGIMIGVELRINWQFNIWGNGFCAMAQAVFLLRIYLEIHLITS